MTRRQSAWFAAAIAFPIIAIFITGLFALSYAIWAVLGLPALNLPVVVRLSGGAVFFAGLALGAWTFANRNPASVIVSTCITLVKFLRRAPVSDRAGRTEPLVISGPQRYTRNPLYFGVVVMVFGWALWGSSTYLLIAALVLLLFYSLLLIPFEEKELHALFGEAWERYSKDTPMLVPFTKRKKTS